MTKVQSGTLKASSMLTVILLPLHIGGDIAFGFDKGGPGLVYVVVPILLAVTCGALLLVDHAAGYILMLLGGLASLGMPIIHRNNGFTPAVAIAPGGLFFIWTLVMLGVAGGLSIILSIRGLLGLRARPS